MYGYLFPENQNLFNDVKDETNETLSESDIKVNSYYKVISNPHSIIAKRNIKNVLIDKFYDALTVEEDAKLMDILNSCNTFEEVKIMIKGGGAFRIYDNMFKNAIKQKMPSFNPSYKEKISDIDVSLESKKIDSYDLEKISIKILDNIRTLYSNFITNLWISKKQAVILHLTQEFSNNINYKGDLLTLYNEMHPNSKIVGISNYKLMSLEERLKSYDSMLYNDRKHTYILFTDKLLRGALYPDMEVNLKEYNFIDISFNHKFVLCKADITEFGLARLRLCFTMKFDITTDTGNKVQLTIPSYIELFDISSSHQKKQSTIFSKAGFYINSGYDKKVTLEINNREWFVYSLEYVIRDLIKVLFTQSVFPWSDKKYPKRIKRLFHYSVLLDLYSMSKNYCKDNIDLLHDTLNIINRDDSVITRADNSANKVLRSWMTQFVLASNILKNNNSILYYFCEQNIQLIMLILKCTNCLENEEKIIYNQYIKHMISQIKCSELDVKDTIANNNYLAVNSGTIILKFKEYINNSLIILTGNNGNDYSCINYLQSLP